MKRKKYIRVLFAHIIFIRASIVFMTLCISEKCKKFVKSLAVKRIMIPFPIFLSRYKTANAHYFHMMGQRRLCNFKLLQYLAAAKSATSKHLKYLKSCIIGKCFQDFFTFTKFHFAPHIYQYLYYTHQIDVCQ